MVQDVAVHWWAILVATPIPLAIGAAWYSPLGFARQWMRRAGLSDSDLRRGMALGFGAATIAGFLLAWVLATTLAFAETANAVDGLLGGFFCWLGFTAATFAANDFMERRPAALWAINAGYWLLVFLADGALLGAWSPGAMP